MKRLIAFFICILMLIPSLASAAITLDSADASFKAFGLRTTLASSHTVSGSNPLVLVCVEENTATPDVTGGTIGATNLTILKTSVQNTDSGSVVMLGAFPPTGSSTVTVVASSAQLFRMYVASYDGVAQTGLPDAVNSNNGLSTSWTATVTSAANNDWDANCEANDTGSVVVSAGGIERANTGGSGFGYEDSNAAVTPAGLHTFSLNAGGGNAAFTNATVAFAPFVAAPSIPPAFSSFYGWW